MQLEQCDGNNDGFEAFNLTLIAPQILGGLNPADYTLTYHFSQTNAQANVNPITNPTSYTNIINPQIIWARVTNNSNGQFTIVAFSLQVNSTPNLVTEVAFACDEDNDGFALFDLSIPVQQILAGNNATPNTISVTFYMTDNEAQNQLNSIGFTFQNTEPNQMIFVRIENFQTGCFIIAPFYLLVETCTICENPVTATVTNFTQTSASFTWTNTNPAMLWEVVILPSNSPNPNPNTQGTLVNQPNFTFSNLQCGTTYFFYVRTYCETNQTTSWSNPYTVQTLACTTPQGIIVNQMTVSDLINNVIINENCAGVSNFTSSNTVGIGYFNNNESSFPFSEGMILRSGIASNTSGTYTATNLSSVGSGLTDAQLQAISNTSGNTGTVTDVSFVKFDLTPTSNILSFNFLFASNEYGQFQCSFSDVFAFILTDLVTNQTQNLAVIPGTNQPVSVTNIRNNAHNNSCPSVNPQFFGSYNVNNPNSAINMIGQTVPMSAYANVIPNRNYSLKLVIGDYQDSSFDSAIFIEGGSLNTGNQCADSIQLVSFVDENNNGIKDENEINFVHGSFAYQENGNIETTLLTSPSGVAFIHPEPITNLYDLNYEIISDYQDYYATSSSYTDVSIEEGSGTTIYYFPITIENPYVDVAVSIVSLNQPVPGFTYNNKIVYTNNGITPASGTLTFTKDSMLTITNVSPTGTTPTATGFTYNYTSLAPNESRFINVSMLVPTIPTVALGNLVTNTATITSTEADVNLNNNSSTLTKTIVGSYDPNDKSEIHGGKISFYTFGADDYLYYTIRFENEGTANATFIRLEDNLDELLDETTIEMISASHSYVLERKNNDLVWKFDYIYLPPKMVNPSASQGYVHFKIKPKTGYQVGTIIPNFADIYFDTNPAIITNTVHTEFVTTLSTTDIAFANFGMYPNPANDFVMIQLSNTSETLSKIVIYDILGKVVSTKVNLSTSSLNYTISDLTNGVYFVDIITSNNQKVTKKLVKQ